MDLRPVNPSDEAPRDDEGNVIWGRYNISGWSYFRQLLEQWEVNTDELSGMNDGEVISEETCIDIADAIESNLDTMHPDDREWLEPKIALWRTCGGYEQW